MDLSKVKWQDNFTIAFSKNGARAKIFRNSEAFTAMLFASEAKSILHRIISLQLEQTRAIIKYMPVDNK